MDDDKYLLKYSKAFEMIFPSHMEDCTYIKNIELKYQTVTDKMIYLLGGTIPDDVLNHTLSEIAEQFNINNPQIIKKIMTQDLQIISHKKCKNYLQIMFFNGKNNIWLQCKTPIINPETNNCVGIRGQITKLIWPHAVKTLFKMHESNGLLIGHQGKSTNQFEDYPLNSFQHMVLFLCLNNYSYSAISVLLDEFGHTSTPVRVNDYLEQLKLIFHVSTKGQLIEKAIGLNFNLFLPDGLFSKWSSIEIMDNEMAIICNQK